MMVSFGLTIRADGIFLARAALAQGEHAMSNRTLAATLSASVCLIAGPALANDHYALPPIPQPAGAEGVYQGEWDGEWIADGEYEGEWRGRYRADPYYRDGYYEDAGYRDDRYRDDRYRRAGREAWLDECRSRYRDSNIEGGLIGGVLGGIAGNRIAGRGNRILGTVAGAIVGGVAGTAIDSLEGGRGDECEAYLDRYMAYGQGGYGQGGYGQGGYGYSGGGYADCGCNGYAMTTRMVPVTTYRFGRVESRRDEIVEDVVDTVIVEDVHYETIREPVAPAPRAAPGKRIRYGK